MDKQILLIVIKLLKLINKEYKQWRYNEYEIERIKISEVLKVVKDKEEILKDFNRYEKEGVEEYWEMDWEEMEDRMDWEFIDYIIYKLKKLKKGELK